MVIRRLRLYEEFNRALKTKKIIYICGPTGWGKTTAVLDWLDFEVKSYTYLSAKQKDFVQVLTDKSEDIVVIDDMQNINDIQTEQLILKRINNSAKSNFILVGRCPLPTFLKTYQLTSRLTCFESDSFKFDRDMIADLLCGYGITDPTFPIQIETATKGYPMAVFFMSKWLTKGEPMNAQTFEKMKQDMFECYDEFVFKYWETDQQKFMLHMATFETFTEKMASMVTGKKEIIAIIKKALSDGSYLTFQPPNTYLIHPVFRKFLLHKQHFLCSSEFMQNTYHNAALYYELENNIDHALYYYELCNDKDKLAELLILNSNLHPGNGYYYEMERYYHALPKETILVSPDLMSGMCMLCSLYCRIEESEYWFLKLQQYQKRYNKQDPDYKYIQGKLSYLKIALPHRGSKHIAAILLDVAKAYRRKDFQLQEFSVTGNLPSLLNGGKDFCKWIRHDKKLYSLMKKPVEEILGKYGVGLADIALAESLFEKSTSDNLTEIMILANAGQNAAAFKGTLEIEFAATGILSRVMLMQNNLRFAYTLLDSIESRAKSAKMNRMVSNVNALRMRFVLMEGKQKEAEDWFNMEAPDETKPFKIMDRYCYLTKVRCYLTRGEYSNAIALLAKLLDYFKSYDRIYGQLEVGILLAITQYRMKQEGWQQTLNDTLVQCEYYGFIRFIAEEGVALLPLLKKASLSVSADYARSLNKEIRCYALYYPLYQKPRQVLTEPLTDTEKTVLHLICKGLTNHEIAQLMDVTLRTVKFHTGNLYAKMMVKNRAQAIKMAKEIL